MDSISIFKNLEYTQKRKPYPLKFGDVLYYFFDIVKRKTDAERYVNIIRQLGYKARIVTKAKYYEIYIRG